MKFYKETTLVVPTVRYHPGIVLFYQFMKPCELSAKQLAAALHVSPQRIGEILNGRRGISAETALRLSRLFGTAPKFWLDLQAEYDLGVAEQKWSGTIDQQISPIDLRKEHRAENVVQSKSLQIKNDVRREQPPLALKNLNHSEKKVYDLLLQSLTAFDALCRMTGMSASEISVILVTLELAGLVKRHPGDQYSTDVST